MEVNNVKWHGAMVNWKMITPAAASRDPKTQLSLSLVVQTLQMDGDFGVVFGRRAPVPAATLTACLTLAGTPRAPLAGLTIQPDIDFDSPT